MQFNNLKGATPEEMRAAWSPFAGTRAAGGGAVRNPRRRRDHPARQGLSRRGPGADAADREWRGADGDALCARSPPSARAARPTAPRPSSPAYLNKLTEDEYFDRNRAERYLLLARDLPGYNVQLTLKPAGTGPGELIGEVAVLRRRYSLDATVQNLAAQETGRWGGQLRGQLYGLTGLGDVTSLAFYSTFDFKEQKILQASHSFRPGSEGLVIDGQFTYAWTKPDIDAGRRDAGPEGEDAVLDDRRALSAEAGRNRRTCGPAIGFDYVDQKVDFFGPLTRDKLRVLWLRGEWDAVDLTSRRPAWRANALVELRKGIDIFDASEAATMAARRAKAAEPVRRRCDRHRPSRWPARASLRWAATSPSRSPRAPNMASTRCSSFEEFTAGNYTVGRGYDPATLSGDSGVGLTAELRGPRLMPMARSKLSLQPYVFGDAAWVWDTQ